MSHTRTVAAAMALAASLSTPLTARAADAMRVVRDPVTGELRGPTAAEAAAAQKAEAAQRAGAKGAKTGPVEIRYPDGTIETKLDEDSMMYSVVALGPDGKLNFECLPNKQARQFVKSAGKKTSSAAKAVAKVGHEHP